MNSPVTAAPTILDVEHILVDVVFVLFLAGLLLISVWVQSDIN